MEHGLIFFNRGASGRDRRVSNCAPAWCRVGYGANDLADVYDDTAAATALGEKSPRVSIDRNLRRQEDTMIVRQERENRSEKRAPRVLLSQLP